LWILPSPSVGKRFNPFLKLSRLGGVDIAQWIFVEGKMRALFGLLFGAGTVLLLERIERRAGSELAADVFHRRNMWLLFFGIIHGTLISSDCLGTSQRMKNP
jgi:uncharacterized membrane protein YeiB